MVSQAILQDNPSYSMIQIPDLYFFSASTEKSCDKDWSQLFYYTYFSTSKEKVEPVFLVSEFSLRYVLIFEDKILVLDFSSRYQNKNSQMHF